MTNSGDVEPEREHRARRAAEAKRRADQARERAQEARERLAELRQEQGRVLRHDARPTGSRADQAERAGALAEESKWLARRAAENAAAAYRASADVHDLAARLHTDLAESGFGDSEQHRRQAQQHQRDAAMDRVEAQHDDELGERFGKDPFQAGASAAPRPAETGAQEQDDRGGRSPGGEMSSGSDSIQARVDELLSKMTPAEKAGQLTQYFYFRLPAGADTDPALGLDVETQPRMVEQALGRGEAGSLLFVTDPAEMNRLQRLAIEGNPHGIPLLFGFDVIHGLRTIFPVPIAMAASWDLETIERGQAVAAREARAVGIHWTFAPMVDIARDPRWGRIIEGAGEDPVLGAAVAAAQVRGFQGTDLAQPDRIIAGPKHFAGYGAALGGRDYDEVNLSEYELWNTYFPPFRAAVEAGAGNVMTAYMDLNGVPASASRWLFTEVLRQTWGFDGFVVSDANAVRNLVTHGFATDLTDAAARAVTAGVDMEMAITDPAYAHLPEALESGAVAEDVIEARVRKILEAKLRLGLFDDPYVDEDRAREVLADPQHREVARVAAERSAVLLRNEGGLLPLDLGRLGSIAVIGPLADSQRDTIGPWVFDFDLDETVTVLDGIRRAVGDRVRVDYAPGIPVVQRVFASMFDMFGGNRPADPEGFEEDSEFARAVDLAAAADVAVVVAGEWQNMIGEAASRSSIELPGRQLELMQAVAATGTPTVLLVMNGRPLDLRWAAENVPAILDIWYPGSQGGAAVANLLFGVASPGGKLPFSWPRTVGQVPMIYSHTRSHEPDNQGRRYWDEASTPLFPFGHGLSYGAFDYADLTVEPAAIPTDGTVTVSVQVTNTADREAPEVVQLYLHQRHGSASRPVRELKDFQRVVLPGGTSRQVQFTIGPEQRRYWNTTARDWVLDNAVFDIWVGGDSTAELTATVTVGRTAAHAGR